MSKISNLPLSADVFLQALNATKLIFAAVPPTGKDCGGKHSNW